MNITKLLINNNKKIGNKIYFGENKQLILPDTMKLLKLEKQKDNLYTFFLKNRNGNTLIINNLFLTIKKNIINRGSIFGITGKDYCNLKLLNSLGKEIKI